MTAHDWHIVHTHLAAYQADEKDKVLCKLGIKRRILKAVEEVVVSPWGARRNKLHADEYIRKIEEVA